MHDVRAEHPMEGGLTRTELAVMAHEIRGALTVISGLSDIVSRRELEPADREMALTGIQRAVARIDGLVQAALDGELSGGGSRSTLDLADLVKSVADECRTLSGREIRVDVRAHPQVAGVPETLERLFGNLIDNALKYSLSGASVDVAIGTEDGEAIVSVSDRGPGIPEEMREQVFEPFSRIAGDDVPGTGLGLTVVARIAESHGGSVRVDGREGGGAEFVVRLPLA